MRVKRFTELSNPAKVYVGAVTTAGAFAVVNSAYRLVTDATPWDWLILALLTLVSGSATIKLPSLPATISVSETFVFTSVLLFGVPAGTLTVALDALVISFWSYRRGHPLFKIVFNLFALPLTIWIAAQIFFSLPAWEPFLTPVEPLFRSDDSIPMGHLLGPLTVLAVAYFSLNSWIIAIAISLERGLSPLSIWRENFAWLSLNYFGGASVAALLVAYTRNNIDWGYLALIVPLLVVLYFTFSTAMGRVEDANRHLSQLNSLYMSTIETLAMAIDAKDQITHGHIRRVQVYAVGLANRLGVSDPSSIKAIEAAALLHDMGKLAVPEYILNKPGPLTTAEFEKMKLHATVGADILSSIDFPYPVVPIVRHHHENWDGSGYPDGLAGTDIPIGARILSVVDCFDALTSDRPYRPKLTDRDAIRILLDRRGSMYDPLVVDRFLEVHSAIAPEQLSQGAPLSLKAITEASTTSSTSKEHHPLDEIAASTEEMLTLFDLARGLNTRMSVQDAGDLVAKHLRRLVPCSLCVFFLYRPEEDELVACHASGDGAALVAGLRIELGQRLSGWVAANRRPIRNSDAVLDLGEAARGTSPRLRSSLAVPLLSNETLVGVLTLYSTGHQDFSEEHQRVVEVVSRQVSTILRHATDFDQAKTSMLRDQTTGLPNVEHLRELEAAQVLAVGSEPTSVILVKVDLSTKPERDDSSDVAVRRAATVTRKHLRATDFLFRYATTELLALCLYTDADACAVVRSRVSEALEKESRLSNLLFTAIASIASSPRDGRSVDELIRVARERLRQAPAADRSHSIH